MRLKDLIYISRVDLKIYYCNDFVFYYYPSDCFLDNEFTDDFLNLEIDHISIVGGYNPHLRVYLK